MKIKYKIWFEEHGVTVFEPSLDVYFKQLEECRSLNSAVKKLNLSYRLVWGKIKNAEERLGIRLVEIDPDEKKMCLTKSARASLKIFNELEKEITPILRKAKRKMAALRKNAMAEMKLNPQ
jgi:molybdate transport system regulatory protein